jgi:hypothetical protein
VPHSRLVDGRRRCRHRYVVAEWEMLGIIGRQKRNRRSEIVVWPNWLEQGEGKRQQKAYRCKDRPETSAAKRRALGKQAGGHSSKPLDRSDEQQCPLSWLSYARSRLTCEKCRRDRRGWVGTRSCLLSDAIACCTGRAFVVASDQRMSAQLT